MTVAQAACVERTLAEGHRLLQAGVPALSVVEEAIRLLEDSGLFNAGRGSNRQLDGVRRMDASIMEGRDLRAGAVASIEGILHPVTAARLVMEKPRMSYWSGSPPVALQTILDSSALRVRGEA